MKTKFLFLSLLFTMPLAGCGNWNIKTGSNDIQISSGGGIVDQTTRDIVSSEYDFQGNLIDCTIGRSSRRRKLPSCNEVLEKRSKEEQKFEKAEAKRLEKLEREAAKANRAIARKKSTTNSFTFPNGLKIKTNTQIRFNPETKEIIVNSEVFRQSGDINEFMKIFIEGNSKIEISFFDNQKFELVDPIVFPLNIYEGQEAGFKYRKNVGKDSSDLKAIKMVGRKQIGSLSEYSKITSIGVSLKI